jgi:hypothetical protein
MDKTGIAVLAIMSPLMGLYVYVHMRKRWGARMDRAKESLRGVPLKERLRIGRLVRAGERIEDPGEARLVRVQIDSTLPMLQDLAAGFPFGGLRRLMAGLFVMLLILAPFTQHGLAVVRALIVLAAIYLFLRLLTRRLLLDPMIKRYEKTRAANGWNDD